MYMGRNEIFHFYEMSNGPKMITGPCAVKSVAELVTDEMTDGVCMYLGLCLGRRLCVHGGVSSGCTCG